jgi:ABC-type antimicrobial peptide transport system permease subunit
MNPPKRALQFLRWFCREDYIDEIEGDLTELFLKKSAASPRIARWQFIFSVLRHFRPAFIKQFSHMPSGSGMYKSYFVMGWRTALRNKGYFSINIGGLGIGMMVAILNGLWIAHEFSFNKYFDNYDRIANVALTGIDLERGGKYVGTTVTYPLTLELMNEYDEQFERMSRATFFSDRILANGENRIIATGLYVDGSFPEMFSFRMVKGSRAGLTEQKSLMISQSLATSLFGTGDPINRIVRFNNGADLQVTGVFEDFPQNTDLYPLRFFTTWTQYLSENPWIEKRALTDLRNHFLKLYVEIQPGHTFEGIASAVKGALQFDPQDLERRQKQQAQLSLYSMDRWHLHPTFLRDGQFQPVMMIKLIGIIGAFVLILACINFINLSTARAEQRAKEVGIRKTIGSMRSQLVGQFFCESILVVTFAFLLAMGLTIVSLPGFNELASKNIAMPWASPLFWLASAVFIVFTGVLAGFYPALYLSSFKPVSALKRTFRPGRFASTPRKLLVVFQFSISVVLVAGTIIVYQQIQFAKDRPVGYDREGLIMIRERSEDFKGKYESLRHELKNTGVVYEVSESMGPVTDIVSGNNGWEWKGMDPKLDEGFATLAVSHLHGKTVGWRFLKGRDFDMNIISDSSGLIINEAALKVMKLEDPIGEPVRWTWWADKSRVLDYNIIGVVEDMVMDSPYAPAEPTVFYLKGHNGTPNTLNIKVSAGVSISEALPKIEAAFRKVIPAVPFTYSFVDDEYAKKFGKEERIGNMATLFAVLAIVISCLGLLGLASFVAETRTKEIGIRKVLGATVVRIWRMLSSDFVRLILLACLLSAPLAYFLMNRWLEKFSYRIEISLWVFVLTAMGAIGVTLATISYQAIKAATTNPVKSLRSE